MKAWHFSAADNRLGYGDGRLIEIGVTHSVEGEPVLCSHGLHGSTRIVDALQYADGPNLWRVEISGQVQKGDDKMCGLHRTAIALYPCEELLREFARKCALQHVEKIKPYTNTTKYYLIAEYLVTGREDIREAAREAAWDAAWEAAGAAASEAACAAASEAAWSAWAAAREARAAGAAEKIWQERALRKMIREQFGEI